MDRRQFLIAAAAFAGAGPAFGQVPDVVPPIDLGDAVPFDAATVVERARAMAAEPYKTRNMVPQAWRDMDYDQYRLFWFNTKRAIWRDTDRPAQMDFFLPGLYFDHGIEVNVVENGQAQPVAFDLSAFDRTDTSPDLPIDESLGYSGFRLRGEIEKDGIFQEYAVFQGASYFRALGRGQGYGLSARGLALNTADAAGEEFPDFTAFWVEAPVAGSREVVMHALLDSPSVTGAYRIVTRHGDPTEMRVEATIFPRVDLTHVGIAPLTSMFLFDETNRHRFNDFRPQVHDSDGLLVHNGNGEMLWRTLANPVSLQVSSFVDENPKGFGLMQRARDFNDFADLEAHYHKRPSLWIEPRESWGKGAVTLVEIPADREIYDNTVAYWRPRDVIKAGTEFSMSYDMQWGGEPSHRVDVAKVINSRMGSRFSGGHLTTVDFEDHALLPDDLADLTLAVTSNTGDILGAIIQRNPSTGGARLAFTFDPEGAQSVELRAQLLHDGVPVSEVWMYRWTV